MSAPDHRSPASAGIAAAFVLVTVFAVATEAPEIQAAGRGSGQGPLGNLPPVADAGGPYGGVVGFPVHLDGSASSDADGDTLTYTWEIQGFGAVHGATADVVFTTVGPYDIQLIVSDGLLADTAATTATVAAGEAASTFVTGGDKTIRLGSGKREWCVHFEPVEGSFELGDVDLTSIRLTYPNATSAPAIQANNVHDAHDSDHDGIAELEACFTKDELRKLFADLLGQDRRTVSVIVSGALLSGPTFLSSLDVDVDGGNGRLAATVRLAPDGRVEGLNVETASASAIRASVYDLRGRLLHRVEVPSIEGGAARVGLGSGAELSPGVYFYCVEQAGERVTGRFLILR